MKNDTQIIIDDLDDTSDKVIKDERNVNDKVYYDTTINENDSRLRKDIKRRKRKKQRLNNMAMFRPPF